MTVWLFVDGGSRGNPGPSAYGFVIVQYDGEVLFSTGAKIGIATNNVAEYTSLIEGLKKVLELGISEVDVISDSKLLVNQMMGTWRIANPTLRELSEQAHDLAEQLGKITYLHVPREQNKLADRLVNEALDK
jgi:ribonuclease HI